MLTFVDFVAAMAVAVMEVDEAQTPTIQYGNMYAQPACLLFGFLVFIGHPFCSYFDSSLRLRIDESLYEAKGSSP
jgi:hypothetical protein